MSRRSIAVAVGLVAIAQMVLWAGIGRHRLRAVTFQYDLSRSEEVVASGSYVSSDTVFECTIL